MLRDDTTKVTLEKMKSVYSTEIDENDIEVHGLRLMSVK